MLNSGFVGYREKALAVTNFKGVEPAMEWLLAHADDLGSSAPGFTVGGTVGEGSSTGSVAAPPPPQPPAESISTSTNDAPEAKSLRCDDCGKLFKNQEEVEYHAAKTNHSSFSESTEEKKPLTEEEKKAQLELLEERLKLKRKEREDREKVRFVIHIIDLLAGAHTKYDSHQVNFILVNTVLTIREIYYSTFQSF